MFGIIVYMKYVYIDESGETGRSSKYIVFASIETTKHRPLEKAIKKIWRAKPHLHTLGELHANAVDDATRNRVLLTLNELDIYIYFQVVDKSKHNKSLQDTYYLELAKFITTHEGAQVIVVDKKDTNKKRDEIILRLNLGNAFENVIFEESHRVKQLQAVDFIAWALGRYYEQQDDTYILLIGSKLVKPIRKLRK